MEYTFKLYRGDTFLSDFFTLYDQAPSEFATQDEIDQGVADGIYTIINPQDLIIRGEARTDYDDLKMLDLEFIKTDTSFYFKISPEQTASVNGSSVDLSFVYDIEIEDQDGTVTTVCTGNITVLPDATTGNLL